MADGVHDAPTIPGTEPAKAFFVSYTHVDRRWAEWIAWQLEAAGYPVVIQAWDFAPGSNFIAEMDKATRMASRTIAVLSADYVHSDFARAEWAAALAADPSGEQRKLLPVRVGAFAATGLLAQVSWVDLVDCDEPTARARLISAVEKSRAKPVDSPAFPGMSGGSSADKPTFPSAVSEIWNVPARNRNFTGRSDWLAQLGRAGAADRRGVVVHAIAGLGGIGKSQLAIEFAYRNAEEYRLVWWVRAETPASRQQDLLALARRLPLPTVETAPVDDQIAALRSWLERSDKWLLIFDNVESPNDIRDLLPQAGAGHVLLTTRNLTWGPIASVLKLDLWTPEEAVEYLTKRTKHDNAKAAAALAETLGFLPLAIEQAAAYIDESQITIAGYTELFRKSRRRLLGANSRKVTVATVWSLSLESVKLESPAAVTLLRLAAFLPPDHFPRERLRTTVSSGPLADLLGNELALNDSIATLRRYSLIDATPLDISVHRLVQAVIQEALSSDESAFFAKAAHRIQHATGEEGLEEPQVASVTRSRVSLRVSAAVLLASIALAALVIIQWPRGPNQAAPPAPTVKPADASTRAVQFGVPSAFGKALAKVATNEYETFHDMTETAAPLNARITEYYKVVGLPGQSASEVPWSSVFIAFCVRSAGASADDFPASLSTGAVTRRLLDANGPEAAFRVHPTESARLLQGDVLIQNVASGTDTLQTVSQSSRLHAKIVVEVGIDAEGPFAVTVGGNESDSIRKTLVRLNPDATAKQRAANSFIGVIRTTKP
jgi:TIR domain/Uncharacterized protein conserved in bacteria (DUF2272)